MTYQPGTLDEIFATAEGFDVVSLNRNGPIILAEFAIFRGERYSCIEIDLHHSKITCYQMLTEIPQTYQLFCTVSEQPTPDSNGQEKD